MRSLQRTAVVALLLCAGAGSLQGQASDALYTRWAGYTGFQFQSYSVSGTAPSKATEWAIPFVMVAPLGDRMSADLTGHYADAKVSTTGQPDQTLSGLTDTQVRLLYTLNRDRAVASLSFNLPTGQHTLTAQQFGVYGAVGSNYLSFPVSDFGTAFGVTGGVALAMPAGAWNVGVSGAVRYTGSYTLFADSAGGQGYKPGVEFRGRLGVDRLMGQKSRLLLGLTASTFSSDELSGPSTSTVGSGKLAPGLRVIGDAGWASALGSATLTIGVWDYYRVQGTFTNTADSAFKTPSENVLNAEARLTFAAAPRVSVAPLVSLRNWMVGGQSGGTYFAGGVAARFGLSDQFSAGLEGRYSSGKALDQQAVPAALVSFTGASLQLVLQYQH
jgi:hypothetical protein